MGVFMLLLDVCRRLLHLRLHVYDRRDQCSLSLGAE